MLTNEFAQLINAAQEYSRVSFGELIFGLNELLELRLEFVSVAGSFGRRCVED